MPIDLNYEPAVSDALLKLVRPGDTVLDVGANRGILTQLCAMLAGPRGTVVAFEPNLELHAEINERIGTSPQARLVGAAVSELAGQQLKFYLDRRAGMHGVASSLDRLDDLSGSDLEVVGVTTTTIDSYCEEHSLRPAVIKIDAEGVEARILSGAARTIEAVKPAVILEVWWSRYESLLPHIRKAIATGYEVWVLETGVRLGIDEFEVLHSGPSKNILLCPTGLTVRFEQAPLFRPEIPFESALRAADDAFTHGDFLIATSWFDLAGKCGHVPQQAVDRHAISLHKSKM